MFERFKKFVQKIYDFLFSESVAEIILMTYSVLLIILGAIFYVYYLSAEGFFMGTLAILIGCLIFITTIKCQIIDDDLKHYVSDIEIKDKKDDKTEESK